jgi:hypothetical protein
MVSSLLNFGKMQIQEGAAQRDAFSIYGLFVFYGKSNTARQMRAKKRALMPQGGNIKRN